MTQTWRADTDRARRKAVLDVATMFGDITVTVYAASVLVAGSSLGGAVGPALVSGAVAALVVAALRMRVPARVRPRQPEAEEPSQQGGWDASSVVLAAVVIPAVMTAGFLLSGWLMVVVVLAFTVVAEDATLSGVVAALVVSIGVSVCVELAVVQPLMRRWDIAPD